MEFVVLLHTPAAFSYKTPRKQAMSKPWDSLRKPVKSPIGPGIWCARGGAQVEVIAVYPRVNAKLEICRDDGGGAWYFSPDCLRQLAEFCTELADQLEGK